MEEREEDDERSRLTLRKEQHFGKHKKFAAGNMGVYCTNHHR